MTERVVVTGLGIVSPIGIGVEGILRVLKALNMISTAPRHRDSIEAVENLGADINALPDYEGGNPLEDEDAIIAYISREKEKIEAADKGLTPKILLRGDKGAFIKRAKVVARAAGKAGVDQIIFAAYIVSPIEEE